MLSGWCVHGLTKAVKCGADSIRATMVDTVILARIHGVQIVDRGLGEAATYGRSSAGDLQSITTALINDSSVTYVTGESDSLAQGEQSVVRAHHRLTQGLHLMPPRGCVATAKNDSKKSKLHRPCLSSHLARG